MKCPNCHYGVADSSLICPICFTKMHDKSLDALNQPNVQNVNGEAPQVKVKQVVVKTIKTNSDDTNVRQEVQESLKPRKKVIRKKTDYFFIAVILIGVVILVSLIIFLFLKNDNGGNDETTTTTTTKIAEGPFTKNKGYRSTFNYPLNLGQTTIASVYDETTNTYTNVDVLGIRFIEGDEAYNLGMAYAIEPLTPGFEWIGFEYQVTFNDLEYLSDRALSPVLNAKIYKWNGCDFINYNGQNYILNVVSIYEGNDIKNSESATVKVLYQLPIGQTEYSVCFGDYNKTMGCFSK